MNADRRDHSPAGVLRHELDGRARAAAQITAMAAVIIYPTWTLFDYVMAPQWWRTFGTIRFLQTAAIVAAYLAWRRERIRTETFLYIMFLGMALEIAFMCAVVPDAVLTAYFLGFSTLFVAAGILILWNPGHSVVVLAITLGALVAASYAAGERTLRETIETGGFMFVTLAIVSILLTRMRWQMVRDEILARARLEAAHRELTSSNRALERFAAAVSHDLKTPMNRMSMAVGVLDDPAVGDSTRRDTLDTLRRAVESATRTIDELLRAARPRGTRQADVRPSADVRDVYTEVVDELSDQIRDAGGRATADFTGCPEVAIDRGQLKSILLNLMTNAVKFRSPDRPLEIDLRAVCADDVIVLSVSDNGRGIDLDAQCEGGLPLRQHPEIEGSGLGIRLVKEMVDAAGGRLELEGALDRGTTFRVSLPKAAPQAAH